MSAIVKKMSHGFLKDGRSFQIIDFESLVIAEDGTIHSGTVGVSIDGKYGKYPISTIAENINYASLPCDMVCR